MCRSELPPVLLDLPPFPDNNRSMTENSNIPAAIEIVEGRWGPHMAALTERQRAFVSAIMEMGDNNHKRAAAMAGFTGNDNTLRVTGHRLAHDSRVQAAMQEEAQRRLNASTVMAVSVLVNIANDTIMDPKHRIKAAGMIMDRTGLHAKSEHKVVTEDVSRTDEAMVARIKELASMLGIDEKKLLGQDRAARQPIVEAEFTEVTVTPSEAKGDEVDWSAL